MDFESNKENIPPSSVNEEELKQLRLLYLKNADEIQALKLELKEVKRQHTMSTKRALEFKMSPTVSDDSDTNFHIMFGRKRRKTTYFKWKEEQIELLWTMIKRSCENNEEKMQALCVPSISKLSTPDRREFFEQCAAKLCIEETTKVMRKAATLFNKRILRERPIK